MDLSGGLDKNTMYILERLCDITWLSVILALSLAMGRALLRFGRVEFSDELSPAVFALSLGLGMFSSLTFLLGIFGCIYTWVFYLCFLAVAALLWRELKDTGSCIFSRAPFGAVLTLRQHLWILLPLALCIGMNFVGALAPPSSADAMIYHFSMPKLYLKNHTFILWDNFTSHFVQNIHMLYLLGMAVSSAQLSALLSYSMGILLIVAMICFARQFFNLQTGIIAATILYGSPKITEIATSGHVEPGYTLFCFMAIWALVIWFCKSQKVWLVLGGIFSGLAAGSKYYGLMIPLLGSILILMDGLVKQEKRFSNILGDVMLFAGITAVAGCPWYIKNAVYAGNPFFPAFYDWFGAKYFDDELAGRFHNYIQNTKRDIDITPSNFALTPWEMSTNWGRTGFGPVFLTFLPAAPIFLYYTKCRGITVRLIAFIVLFYLAWFLLMLPRDRHLMPIMPWLSLLIAGSIVTLMDVGSRLLRSTIVFILGIILIFCVTVNAMYNLQFVKVIVGIEKVDEHLKKKLWYYPEAKWINAHLPSRTKLGLVTISQVNYYLEVPYLGVKPMEGFIDWSSSPEEILKTLKSLGITHLFHDEQEELSPYSEEDRRYLIPKMNELRRTNLKLIYAEDREGFESRTLGLRTFRRSPRIYEIIYPP